MIIKFKYIWIIFFLNVFINLHSYEIIRDPIFEDYFINLNNDLNYDRVNVYLVKNKTPNAFVIEDNIYFTTGLFELIKDEDTLKAIYLHEYGHIIYNHFQSKKIKIQQINNKSSFYNLFSVGIAVLTGNENIGIGSSISLNSNLIEEISKHSISFEIEADNFMVNQIEKNKLNTSELISFLNNTSETNNSYFRTHPKKEDRVNILKQINFPEFENSLEFEWIKSKYSNNSKIESYNIFFKNLEKGIYNQDQKLNTINIELIKYEAFKKGIFVKDWKDDFQKLLKINNSSFLKIEYINYILENSLDEKYYIIEKLKFDKYLMSEYFYNYIYGKYYSKVNKYSLSNFYFCQFYRAINSKNKADFFCKKYDNKDIPTLDKSYALFK